LIARGNAPQACATSQHGRQYQGPGQVGGGAGRQVIPERLPVAEGAAGLGGEQPVDGIADQALAQRPVAMTNGEA